MDHSASLLPDKPAPDREKFHYVLLRYMDDPVSQEFINVGILLQAPALGFLGVRTGDSPDRVKSLFPQTDIDVFQAALAVIEARLTELLQQPVVGGDVALFADLALSALPSGLAGSFYWSEARDGETADPRQQLAELFDRIVEGKRPPPVLKLR